MAASPYQILNSYKQKFVDALHSSLSKHDKVAQGKLFQSVKADVKILGQKIQLEITMADYWKYVDEGRRAGAKQPPMDAIVKHIASRGEWHSSKWKQIQNYYKNKKGLIVKRGKPLKRDTAIKSLAFLIGRNIKKRGIKPTHFATDVFESDLIDMMKKDLIQAVGRDIKLEITKIIEETT